MSSFKVTVLGVYERVGGVRSELAVVAPCVALYGSPAAVPFDVKGQPGCRYVIPRGEVEFDLKASAMGIDGQPFHDFNGSVSFRVVPGDLPNSLRARWSAANLGEVEATVRALHPYGEVRVWVEDAPPQLIYDAGIAPDDELPRRAPLPGQAQLRGRRFADVSTSPTRRCSRCRCPASWTTAALLSWATS